MGAAVEDLAVDSVAGVGTAKPGWVIEGGCDSAGTYEGEGEEGRLWKGEENAGWGGGGGGGEGEGDGEGEGEGEGRGEGESEGGGGCKGEGAGTRTGAGESPPEVGTEDRTACQAANPVQITN